VMFSPVKRARQRLLQSGQWEKRSKALKRGTLAPERPAEIRIRPMIK